MEHLEIEVKFHVLDLNRMRRRLMENGAQARGRVFEANTLWDTPEKDLARQGSVLRLRQDAGCRLTLKSRVPAADPRFKTHRELETVVQDCRIMEGILSGMGFCPTHCYEKYRETFALPDVQAVLDETPYGVFLELEGGKESIMEVARRLELDWSRRIVLSYLEMFAILKKEEALDFSDATFSSFSGRKVSLAKYLPRFEAGKTP